MYIGQQLHFGLFIYPGGHHIAAWRHPDAASEQVTELDYFRRCALACERGKFDSLFVGDALAARESRGRVVGEVAINNLDPVSVCAAVASVTEHLGVVATLSTSFHEPFLIAAKFATLDHLSGGRAGWNVVTTSQDQAAANFGREPHMEKSLRYERAQEFVDVVRALWDAGERPIAHRGRFFQVEGSLGLPRPPQGRPVLVQAGGSPPGRAFAASIGEAIFTAPTTLPEAQAFRADIHALMAACGRRPETVKILPGFSPILGSTMAEAQRKEVELDELVHPRVGTWMMSEYLKFPLYDLSPDAPVPAADVRAANPDLSPAAGAFLDRCVREALTIAHGGRILARSRTHQSFVGTPETLADHMQTWLTQGGCDGFNLLPAWFPAELDLFVDEAVPILQRRGIYRHDYAGPTLRSHLGLAVPEPVLAAA
ncbi:MAG: LLM class flavin-dependent oxidoreductase [Acetobacteraceae bacterium]|nr:LLM class flavin-dependent oxidoreductase [Acetobacteraceae bacterium]